MNYQQLLKQGVSDLTQDGDYSYEAHLLLIGLCEEEGLDLFTVLEDSAKPELVDLFQQGIKRLLADEPLAYILGYQPFFGYNIKVDQRVLIPRAETEELVGEVLMNIDQMFKDQEVLDVVDIACGSGAIAIALAKEEPKLRVKASDISEDALIVAQANAKQLKANVIFIKSDMLDEFIGKDKFDVVVCNPPYISNDEMIENSVDAYEPHIALFGGEDGLNFYRQVLKDVDKIIKDKALIAFEIGYQQAEAIKGLVKEYLPKAKVEVVKDLQSKDRMIIIKTLKER